MIITKEEFVEYIDFIKEQEQKQNRLIDALEDMSPYTHCDTFIYSSYEDMLVKLLGTVLEDKEDDIGHFLYDMDYLGKDLKDINRFPEDENDNVLYNSPETLYEYLVSNMGITK